MNWKPPTNLPRKAIAGFVAIGLAGVGWLAAVVIPFLPIDHKVAGFVLAVTTAEILFLIGVALLGKAYYRELKDRLIKHLQKPKS